MGLDVTEADGSIGVYLDDTLLTRYLAEPDGSKPGFDVVALPPGTETKPGENLIVSSPHDHPWHFGLFFCQKLVDGINCWESEINAATGRAYGYADPDGYTLETSTEGVSIDQTATWKTNEGDPLVADRRTIGVYEPDAEGYLVTWKQTVSALEETRRLSSETLHGHYSGLSLRFARSLTDGRVRLPDGVDPGTTTPPRAVDGPAGAWCDYTGPLDGKTDAGEPWRAGITMFDHPDNDPHPVNWFIMTEPFGFLAANPTWRSVLTLEAGESHSWRWGLWVHDGEPDEDRIADEYDRFQALLAE
ncbi:PmoA family protein [Natronobiforma cellulositropha]|uniref:PmoA family protein n=1 Tax=Natronobiforma cellulositropha TaxID=1679076 RepID=UPI0021D5E105|nr:PmoA family protein [Natronobiforma cellulositropha]